MPPIHVQAHFSTPSFKSLEYMHAFQTVNLHILDRKRQQIGDEGIFDSNCLTIEPASAIVAVEPLDPHF
jgi:hypothetical protein